MTNTKEIMDKFNEIVDFKKVYTKNELCAILNTIYSDVYSKHKTVQKKTTRQPTKYNIFVSENIGKLKNEYSELSRQDLMKKVGELWRKEKSKEDDEVTNKDESEDEVAKKDESVDESEDEVTNKDEVAKKDESVDESEDEVKNKDEVAKKDESVDESEDEVKNKAVKKLKKHVIRKMKLVK